MTKMYILFASSAVGRLGGKPCLLPISPLERAMPGRAEGGNAATYSKIAFAEPLPPPSIAFSDISPSREEIIGSSSLRRNSIRDRHSICMEAFPWLA